MQVWIESIFAALLHAFALPQYGLSTVFVTALVSATLLPLGSEPAVFGLVKLNPSLFWPAIAVATVGNTLGGGISYWMGLAAHSAIDHARARADGAQDSKHTRALAWLQRFGPKACLLSWLPIFGDPLCAVAGWLRLPFWPCLAYMAIGKFARYLTMTWILLAGVKWFWGG